MLISHKRFAIFTLPGLVLFCLCFILPVILILGEAISDKSAFGRVLSDPLFQKGLWGTIVLGTVAPLFSVAIGFCVAMALNRMKPGMRTASLFAISLPLTFSGLIIAYGFILAFGRAGFVTQIAALFGFDPAVVGALIYSPIGLGLAYSYYLIPRVIMILLPAVQNFDMVQLSVARSLGAGYLRTILEVMLPQILPSLVSAYCLTAAVAMGAYGTALALVGTQMNILPLLLYSKISEGGTDLPSAAAISLILMALCCIIIALGEVFVSSGKNRRRSH
ncbi:ABC transporter permease [Advenella faeciporci]|uniref:ABC transporter permease n=1 Tax=Advenella faeciporci TaxID=797535 RepID=A0A918MY33_9BURK|nr:MULTISPECIES: ABC transporter permease subunit [Advenella]WKU19869.1 ABC transporter permease subunit [Advenella alkanexedens]GGW84369.1 ABC transporter permease [Advenella faeciporci]